MSDMREFYSTDPHVEKLSHLSMNDALREKWDASADEIPTGATQTITVYRWEPIQPTVMHCGQPLEQVIEWLDQEYGDPDGCTYSVTPENMKKLVEAERVFLETVLAVYESWSCRIVDSRNVTIRYGEKDFAIVSEEVVGDG